MSISDDLLKRNLRKVFHLKHFLNNKQEEAVKAILKREQDVIVSMPSGSRKSLCFQLPGIMQANKITIVFSPSTTSIKDQMHYLKKSKISAKSITTSISDDEREQLTKDLMNEKTDIRFLYVTPELATTETFANILQSLHTNDRLAYFAVDEGHCVSQRVQDFRQDHIKLSLLRTSYAQIPWIVLTHIASADVLNDIIENFKLNKPVATFKKSSFRKNLYHDIIFKNTILEVFTHLKKYVISCLESDDDDANAENKNKKPCGIIYCKNRETVDLVVDKLTTQGIFTKAYHGGMRTSDRKKVLDEWMKGVFPVITSTTTSSSSLGKPSIRFVVHWDVPRSIATYYKETGLAGRDRKSSYCRIYYCKLDVMSIDSSLKSDIAKSKDENSRRKALRAHADFLKMSDLCETVMCRHKMFSDYFEDIAPNCKDTCDVCKHPAEASVALDIFHRLPAAPTREATCLVELENPPGNVSPARTIIKEELDDTQRVVEPTSTTVNGQSIKLEHPAQQTPPRNRIRHPRSVSPANTCVKEEEDVNGNLSDELFGMQTQPPGNVSPARTVVKEEFGDDSAVGSDSKAGLKNSFVPPRCVSPAETIIEEKPVVNLSSAGSVTCSPKSVPSGQTTPQYSSSTVIKKEPIDGSELTSFTPPGNQIRSSYPTALTDPITPTTRSQPASYSADSIPGVSSNVTAVEQAAPTTRSADRSPRTRSPTLTVVKTERLSPDKSTGNGTEFPTHPRTPSPTLTIVKDECLSPDISCRTNSKINESFKHEFVSKPSDAASKPTTSKSSEYSSIRPYATDSKQVASTKRSPERSRRTPSPILTNADNNTESDTDYRRSEFNRPFQYKSASKSSHTVSKPTSSNSLDCHLDTKRNPKCERDQSVTSKTPSPSGKIRRSLSNHSCDDCKNPSERQNITENHQQIQSRRRSRSRSPPKRRSRSRSPPKRRSRSRSPSKKRSLNKNLYRRRSRSRSLSKRRSRSRSSSRRRSRSQSSSRRRSRSRSNERSKRYSNGHRRSSPSSSSYRKKSHRKDSHKSAKRRTKRERLSDEFDSDREPKRRRARESGRREHESGRREHESGRREHESETRDRVKRYSSESDAEDNKISSYDRYYSTQPSTSTNGRNSYDSKLTRMRFSVSPDNKTIENDSEPDYGWEDAAPPKPEPQSKSTLAELNPSIKEKMEIFSSKLKSEYDLEVIGSYSKDLFQAIEESIALEAQRKLTELDQKIQKEKDDYARELFGTDNFDSWDDDPALCNVENTQKLKPYKSLVPDDIPLLDKMSMKHVTNAMKLTPARDRNELVFHGNIKKIENEFQGQELPRHLMESIKLEKSIIAELVKKHLMPYYHGGRIQPKEIFVEVARTISHIFYDRFADESIIRQYIDDLFRKVGKVTKGTNLHL